jgi:hypothetical protein
VCVRGHACAASCVCSRVCSCMASCVHPCVVVATEEDAATPMSQRDRVSRLLGECVCVRVCDCAAGSPSTLMLRQARFLDDDWKTLEQLSQHLRRALRVFDQYSLQQLQDSENSFVAVETNMTVSVPRSCRRTLAFQSPLLSS